MNSFNANYQIKLRLVLKAAIYPRLSPDKSGQAVGVPGRTLEARPHSLRWGAVKNMAEYMTFRRTGLCGLFVLLACLAGCAVEPASQAMLDIYRVTDSEDVSTHHKLNPDVKYLRVQVGERELLMVLGYVDATPDGPVQVWYDSDRDVLRLREGRVVGAMIKSGVSWLSVTFNGLPAWNEVHDQASYVRIRDVSPGYRYGIKEKMLIRAISAPDDTQLKDIPTSSLTWFEETVPADAEALPARYALSDEGGTRRVIYAEQCLSSEFCFSWQYWPSSAKDVP